MKFDREAMIAEANDYGLEFKGNISNIALAQLIADFKGEPLPEDEAPPPSPETKPDPEPEAELEEEELAVPATSEVQRVKDLAALRFRKKREKIAAMKRAAMKTQIVTITNKDNRENDVATTAFLSFENQHFGMAKNVPLDIPVQLEQALIDIAERCLITMHKDEVVNGNRTGNKVPVSVKKYVVSYSRHIPE